jgi:hypothetical protein
MRYRLIVAPSVEAVRWYGWSEKQKKEYPEWMRELKFFETTIHGVNGSSIVWLYNQPGCDTVTIKWGDYVIKDFDGTIHSMSFEDFHRLYEEVQHAEDGS